MEDPNKNNIDDNNSENKAHDELNDGNDQSYNNFANQPLNQYELNRLHIKQKYPRIPQFLNPEVGPGLAATIGIVGSFILYQVVGSLGLIILFGMDIKIYNPVMLKLYSIATQFLFLLLPALLFAKWIYKDVTFVIRAYKLDVKRFMVFLLAMVVLIPFLNSMAVIQNFILIKISEASPFVNQLKSWLDLMDKSISETYNQFLAAKDPLSIMLTILLVAITPAICEETLFRGFIQRSFEFMMKPFMAIFVTALFFALFHFNPYGLIQLIILGFYLGYVVYKTGSILASMILHFTNNFVAIVFSMFSGGYEQSVTKVSLNELYISVVMFLVLGALFAGIMIWERNRFARIKL